MNQQFEHMTLQLGGSNATHTLEKRGVVTVDTSIITQSPDQILAPSYDAPLAVTDTDNLDITDSLPPVLVDPYQIDFERHETESPEPVLHTAELPREEPDHNLSPTSKQSFLRRFIDRASEAHYSAGAKWTTLSKRHRALGFVAFLGTAYAGYKVGSLEHTSIVNNPHFFDAAYHPNPSQMHQTASVYAHNSAAPSFSAEVNGHPVKAPVVSAVSTPHFLSEVNGKPVHAHPVSHPIDTAPKAAVTPKNVPKAAAVQHNFVAEVNNQPVTASELHQTAHPVAHTEVHHTHHAANHTQATHPAAHHADRATHSHAHRTHHHNTSHTYQHNPTQGTTYVMHSGDNPWTISERTLGISTHPNANLTHHQLYRIWAYDQQIMHANRILNEQQAQDLQIGRKLSLPKV